MLKGLTQGRKNRLIHQFHHYVNLEHLLKLILFSFTQKHDAIPRQPLTISGANEKRLFVTHEWNFL